MKNSTSVRKDKYDSIVSMLIKLSNHSKKQTLSKFQRGCKKKYVMMGNINKRCLYWRTDESFHISSHYVWGCVWCDAINLGHPRDYRKNKVTLDEKYFKIPEQCIKIFLQLCPLCFLSIRWKPKHRVPLKMIFSPEFGHRAQVDLIDMTNQSINGYSMDT